MRAQYVYENYRFERGADPKDSLQLGDYEGRMLKKIAAIPRPERDWPLIKYDFLAAKKYIIDNYSDRFKIKDPESLGNFGEIICADIANRDWLPYWNIKDLDIKGQFIIYEYSTPNRYYKHKVMFRNNPRRKGSDFDPSQTWLQRGLSNPGYNPYMTWMDLVKKWEEIINDPRIKIPEHKD